MPASIYYYSLFLNILYHISVCSSLKWHAAAPAAKQALGVTACVRCYRYPAYIIHRYFSCCVCIEIAELGDKTLEPSLPSLPSLCPLKIFAQIRACQMPLFNTQIFQLNASLGMYEFSGHNL